MNAKPELRVTDDLVDDAVAIFLRAAPRTIALSGGSTPEKVYERLAATPYPWSEVEVFFGDERCVPEDHDDSNFKMANAALLSNVDARVHSMVGCDTEAYTRELENVFGAGVPMFDLAFMGLGEDGHTASLFPGKPALDVTDRWVVDVPEPGMPPAHPRMTLTLPVFDAAKLSLFLVSGGSKREALASLVAGDESIPATRVHGGRVIVLADREAAAGL
jgi:6-phosphogluconolactonase